MSDITPMQPPKIEPSPNSPPPGPMLSKVRIVAAFAVALVSDFLSTGLEIIPPLQWALDIVTALLLFLILGRQWLLLPALIAEAIPGVAVFPFWVLVVVSIVTWGYLKPSGPKQLNP